MKLPLYYVDTVMKVGCIVDALIVACELGMSNFKTILLYIPTIAMPTISRVSGSGSL